MLRYWALSNNPATDAETSFKLEANYLNFSSKSFQVCHFFKFNYFNLIAALKPKKC